MEEMNNTENKAIHNLVGDYLRRRISNDSLSAETHLDDDMLTAFVEGRLGEKESVPVIKHLVDCGSCRKNTAQLARLQEELGEKEMTIPVVVGEPGRVRRFLEGITIRLFNDDEEESVFAYHASHEGQDESLLEDEEKAVEEKKEE
jgi:hypothetical protein